MVSALSKDLILDGSSANHLAEGLATRLSALGKLPSDTACQAYAKDNFDWPVIAKRVVRVYEHAFSKSLIEQRPRSLATRCRWCFWIKAANLEVRSSFSRTSRKPVRAGLASCFLKMGRLSMFCAIGAFL